MDRADWYPGIERFCSHWAHAPMLQQTFDAMKQEFQADNDACIDAAKGLVECACQTIIRNLDDPSNPIKDWRDSPIKSDTPGFKEWVSAALRLLKLTEVRDDPFSKVLSQHFKLVDELGRYRNLAGPVSHGKEAFARKLSAYHRRAAVLAADALVAFLHEAYLEREPDPVTSQEPYDRFSRSNALIDQHVQVEAGISEDGLVSAVFTLPDGQELPLLVEPSRILFAADPEAYKVALTVCADAQASLEAQNDAGAA